MLKLPSYRGCVLMLAALVALAGCRPADEIRTYPVPKRATQQAAAPAAAPVETGPPVDRMLTAIVPEGGQAWFYKVVGPIAALDALDQQILDFVSSVPPAGGAAIPKWELPGGWSATPGSNGVTLATIRIPADETPLELTVTSLPWGGTADELLRNVNRWRVQQMGLPPAANAEALAKDVRQIKAGENTITVVDLRGRFRRSGMPPFVGGAMPGGAMPGGAMPGGAAPGNLPADHPPLGAASPPAQMPAAESGHGGTLPSAGAAAALPTFDVPASWEASEAGGMNRAVFRLANGAEEALVTVSNIPTSSGAMFADPLQNANLWRSGVGMAPVTAEQLDDASESLEIGGRAATIVAAIPADDQPEATLAAIVTDGDQIWYFKIKGARQLVADKQDEFKAFLKTVQFPETPLP